jgi:transcription elongation factor GreA
MSDATKNVSIAEAIARFLATLPPPQRQEFQMELNRFLRWFGGGRLIAGLTGNEVSHYGDSSAVPGVNLAQRLAPIRAFLSYAQKEGLTDTNLSVNLRSIRPSSRRRRPPRANPSPNVTLSTEGYARLQQELDQLKQERPKIAEELHRAMADKDFRENAPLDAARERQGYLEARIRELEATLGAASIQDRPSPEELAQGAAHERRVAVGSTVFLEEMETGQHRRFTLVNPHEVNLIQRKISAASPLGQAILDHGTGDVVEVQAPAGVRHYRLERIE